MSSLLEECTVSLPHVLVIGFAGDGILTDSISCRSRIVEFLTDRRSQAGRAICGVTTLDPAGQPIFAESCIELEIPLRLIVPLSRERFLQECNPANKTLFATILDRAVSTEVTGSNATLTEGNYECSLQVVQQCQELLAIWDGEPDHGLASTAKIVEFADEMRRPVTWIHSTTSLLQPIHHHTGDRTSEEELKFLNELPNLQVSGDTPTSTALAAAWLAKLDANAAHVAPEVRKLAAVPLICTALAAFVTATAQGRKLSAIWIAAGAVLGLTASFLPRVLSLGPRQALWVRIRTAAEVSRSVVALWATPTHYEIVGPEILPELSSMVRSLNLLKSQAHQSTEITLDEFKERYVKDRLLDQMKYFAHQAAKAKVSGKRYSLVGKVCSLSAIAISTGLVISHSLMSSSQAATSGKSWMGLVTAALFQLATIAGALFVVKDCGRRQRRYLELHHALADWEAELRVFRTWPPIIEVVSKIERALLVELLEWRSLLQNTKLPGS